MQLKVDTKNINNMFVNFLNHVELLELQSKINNFRNLDFQKMSYEDIKKSIDKVLTFDTQHGAMTVLYRGMRSYSKGTRFYRVRKLPVSDRIIPLKSISTVSDCWEPPQSVIDAGQIKAGRLNKENEALIYASPLQTVAIEELNISDGELCSLIVYEAMEDINVVVIGMPSIDHALSTENSRKIALLEDFLKHEFTRDVVVGKEYLYQISEYIAKDYFDLPNDIQDGWCYPSVAKKGGFYNVCFRPEIKNKLSLIGVQFTRVERKEKGYYLKVKSIATDLDSDCILEYYKVGFDVQKRLFPEIS